MKEEFKVLAEFSDPMSAEITAGMLKANGIAAEVFGSVSPYPSLNANVNSVQIKVLAEDYEEAKKLLSEEA